MSEKYIVIVGNPVDGIQIFGPFDDIEDANEWGERNARAFSEDGGTWLSTMLHTPNQM